MRQQIRMVSFSPIPGWLWLAKTCRDRRLTSVLFLAWGLDFAYQAFFDDSNRTWTVSEDLFSPSRTDSKPSYSRMVLVPSWCWTYAGLTVTRYVVTTTSVDYDVLRSEWSHLCVGLPLSVSGFPSYSDLMEIWIWFCCASSVNHDCETHNSRPNTCGCVWQRHDFRLLGLKRITQILTGVRVLTARLPFATMQWRSLCFKDLAWWLHNTQGCLTVIKIWNVASAFSSNITRMQSL